MDILKMQKANNLEKMISKLRKT